MRTPHLLHTLACCGSSIYLKDYQNVLNLPLAIFLNALPLIHAPHPCTGDMTRTPLPVPSLGEQQAQKWLKDFNGGFKGFAPKNTKTMYFLFSFIFSIIVLQPKAKMTKTIYRL